MVPAYARVLLGKKPYVAPPGTVIEPVELEVSGSPVQLIERVYIGWSRLEKVSGEVKRWWRGARLEAWMGLAAEGSLRLRLVVSSRAPLRHRPRA